MTGERILPNLGLTNRWTPETDGWGDGMDADLAALDALLHLAVLSATLASPPASPAEGDRYIVPPSATGAWAGQDNRVAVRLDNAWAFYTPRPGWRARVLDQGQDLVFAGTQWAAPLSTLSYTAGNTINGHRALMFDAAGRVIHADPTQSTYQFAGISTQSATLNTQVQAVALGPVVEPSWAWTPLAPLFVGAAGVLTQTPPATGAAHQVAVAMTPTAILVQPGLVLIRH